MTVAARASVETFADDRLARRNAFVLATAQALAGANNSVLFATAAVIGAVLAPDATLATLPVSFFVVGLWLGTLPVGWLSRRFGRRTAFQIGSAFGVIAGLLCWQSVMEGSFLLLNAGAFGSGLYSAAAQGFRFAAADTASESFRPKAISWVLVGGIAAAILGPQLVIHTKDLWQPYLFAASYLAQAGVALVCAGVLMFVRIPRSATQASGGGRPLLEIASQPRFIVAVGCGVASYAMMNMVMTSAPLAMVQCNHSVTDATLGIQWHILGMFVPSLFTGSLIARFGVERVIGVGLALLVASAAVDLAGTTLWHFWIGLVLLGVGWNFGFIGATNMVTQTYRPNERTRVQSLNDFLVFGSMAIGSFSSGALLAAFGWSTVNSVVFPVVLVAAALLIWQVARQRRQPV